MELAGFPFEGGWCPILGVYVREAAELGGEVSGLEEGGTSTKGSLELWPLPLGRAPELKNLEDTGWVASRIWIGCGASDRV